jgi:heptosyltransferase-2
VAELVASLARHGKVCVLLGARGDAPTVRNVMSQIEPDVASRVIDLTGQTTLEAMAGVLALGDGCVTNDSGAMHVAAAVGTPLVAVFGPTREYESGPLPRSGGRADVVVHPVWCRPCMLRECPIDHRCMKGITPQRVLGALEGVMRG